MSEDAVTYEKAAAALDPDRMAAAFFAPADRRASLIALYGIRLRLFDAVHAVREPMAGHLRLAWWRDQVAGIYTRTGVAGSPDIHALARLIEDHALPRPLIESLIDARAASLTDCPYTDDIAFKTQADGEAAHLMQLAARICGAGSAADTLASAAGPAQAICDALMALGRSLRRRHCPLPLSRLADAGLTLEALFAGQGGQALSKAVNAFAQAGLTAVWEARKYPMPAAARAAILPVVLARQRLALFRQHLDDPAVPPPLSRFTAVMALGRAAWLGCV